MKFLEKNLEDIIFETPNEKLQERDLPISGKKYRQVKIGHYGICDILAISRCGDRLMIQIFELKKEKLDANAMMQAYRYANGIWRYLQKRKFKHQRPIFEITLVGKELCLGDFCYLTNFIHNMQVVTYEYEFDGIRFNEHSGYYLTQEGFDL